MKTNSRSLLVGSMAGIGLAGMALTLCLAYAHSPNASFLGLVADEYSYTMTLNASNGAISDTAYSDTIKSTTSGTTTTGHAFGISYYHAKAASGYYCVLDAANPRTNASGEDGYLYSTNGINGLNSLTITFAYAGEVPGDLLVYFSDSTTFDGAPVIAESGLPVTASGSFFKIQALSQAVNISSIAFSYACDEGTHVYPASASAEQTAKALSSLNITEPTGTVADDFAYGVDLSMVADMEELGGTYLNENGVAEDPFQILSDDGANYARIRLWVDPYTSDGDISYSGGTNDLATDLHLAKRAKAAGMKVLLDLHYSDFWADPSHQHTPKGWTANTSTVSTYTTEVMNAFKDEGITLDAVQVGNEINASFLDTSASSSAYFDLLNAGTSAVKSVFSDAKVVLHLTNINRSSFSGYMNNLCSNVSNFDVLGVSYYPFWHGGTSNLLSALNSIAAKGKEAWVVETSWGFTLDSNAYANNQFNSDLASAGGYDVSAQGQADCLSTIIDVLSQVDSNKGTGIFYWGPDYIPVSGAQWASPEGQYYNDHGTDGDASSYTDDSCKQSWSNQALFDYDCQVLGSAQTYKLVQNAVSGANVQNTPHVYFYDVASDWAQSSFTYNKASDTWTYEASLTEDDTIAIGSDSGSATGYYLNLVDSSLINNVDGTATVAKTGTYSFVVQDGDSDTNNFDYYISNWNESGIVSSIAITCEAAASYTKDCSEGLYYQIVSWSGSSIVWDNASVSLNYSATTDLWTADVDLAAGEGLVIYSVSGGTWNKLNGWYLNQINDAFTENGDAGQCAAGGSFSITITDSETDGDESTSFATYHNAWNNTKILAMIAIA